MTGRWIPESLSIDASAGYGKTQRLCARLLAHFLADPDATRNTVALTFTKPAAGEIYTRMLQMLSSALLDDGELRKLRAALPGEFAAVSRDELHELLARLIGDMGKLNISTIDGFFYRLVRVFAVELGMPGRVELDESGGESPVTEALLGELFGSSGASEELLDACRNSRVGDEKKTFFDSCRDLLKLVQNFRAQRTEQEFWGNGFGAFVPKSRAELAAALEKCENHRWPAKYETTLGPLLRRCAAAADHPEKCRFTLTEKDTLRKFLAVWDDFPKPRPDRFTSGWNYEPVARELQLLLGNGRDVLLYQCAMRTRGLRILLEEYHRLYEQRLLRRGRINFADLPLLLAESAASPESTLEFLNEIRYRTNSRFKHVLIDEFQDTSRAQWRVLEPIAEDNGEGDRSLFIVGDVKQAIYGWREGDSKLMGEVTAQRALKTAPLERSFRYGPDICDALNTLFGALVGRIRDLDGADPAIARGAFAGLARRWEEVFRPHRTAREERPGEFEVLALGPTSYPCTANPGPRPEPNACAVFANVILERLDRVGFFSTGRELTAALLVRDGGNGIRMRDALRAAAGAEFADRIVWEGNESIVNDPLVSSLLAFGVWLQHPADTFAREGAALNLLLRDLFSDTQESRLEWLTLLAERGIGGFLREILKRLADRARSMADDGELAGWSPVENGDMDELLALADAVDASGAPRDLLRFRDLAAAKRKRAAAVAGKLQIMTIHHSKGLTFDMVFHPIFKPAKSGTGNWRSMQDNLPVTGVTDGKPWLLNAPRAEGLTVPGIARAVTARHIDSCFEELCDLYVALTRARYGMYVLLPRLNKPQFAAYHCDWAEWKTDAKGEWKIPQYSPRRAVSALPKGNCYTLDLVFDAFFGDGALFPDLPGTLKLDPQGGAPCLRRVFGGAWSAGKPPEDSQGVRKLGCAFRDAGKRPALAAPSQLDEPRKLYFALPSETDGTHLGTRVHAFFERIGRWRDFTPPADTPAEVLEHYAACAGNGELVALLDEECELWRERRFDVVLSDDAGNRALVSGCFDRVQILRRPDGGIARVCIIDYKSNQAAEDELPALVEHYAPQLASYRKALAALLGVTPNLIDCRIVFTRFGKLFAL